MKRTATGLMLTLCGGGLCAVAVYLSLPFCAVMGALTAFAGILIAYYAISDILGRKHSFKNATLEDVDKMDGHTFENYLNYLYSACGYRVEATKKSHDFGADLILYKDGKKIIVQAKRYCGKVPVAAVQEAAAARSHYRADEAWIVTNNYYTQSSFELALSNNVRLISRNELSFIIDEAQSDL